MVELDCPREIWENSQVREFLGDVLDLRFRGYAQEYGAKIIPADVSDFFATHIVTCQELPNGVLRPISSYKMVSVKRCREFGRAFSGLSVCENSGAPSHAESVRSIMEECDSLRRNLGYCYSWTIDPSIRKDEVLTQLVRNLVYATHKGWQEENNVPEMVIAGVVRFKVDRYQESIGYQRILDSNGDELAHFPHFELNREPVTLLHMKKHSDHCLEMVKKYAHFWNERLIYRSEERCEDFDQRLNVA